MGPPPTSTPPSTATAPLWAEFDAEIVTLERAVARAGQVTSAVALVIALVVGAFVTPAMGQALAVLALASTLWFTASRALLWANPVVELSLPCLALVIMTHTQGAAYALGSWVPPLLFSFVIVLAIMRLQPALPLVLGAVASVAYLAIY